MTERTASGFIDPEVGAEIDPACASTDGEVGAAAPTNSSEEDREKCEAKRYLEGCEVVIHDLPQSLLEAKSRVSKDVPLPEDVVDVLTKFTDFDVEEGQYNARRLAARKPFVVKAMRTAIAAETFPVLRSITMESMITWREALMRTARELSVMRRWERLNLGKLEDDEVEQKYEFASLVMQSRKTLGPRKKEETNEAWVSVVQSHVLRVLTQEKRSLVKNTTHFMEFPSKRRTIIEYEFRKITENFAHNMVASREKREELTQKEVRHVVGGDIESLNSTVAHLSFVVEQLSRRLEAAEQELGLRESSSAAAPKNKKHKK